jgi:hypothetical protein
LRRLERHGHPHLRCVAGPLFYPTRHIWTRGPSPHWRCPNFLRASRRPAALPACRPVLAPRGCYLVCGKNATPTGNSYGRKLTGLRCTLHVETAGFRGKWPGKKNVNQDLRKDCSRFWHVPRTGRRQRYFRRSGQSSRRRRGDAGHHPSNEPAAASSKRSMSRAIRRYLVRQNTWSLTPPRKTSPLRHRAVQPAVSPQPEMERYKLAVQRPPSGHLRPPVSSGSQRRCMPRRKRHT